MLMSSSTLVNLIVVLMNTVSKKISPISFFFFVTQFLVWFWYYF